MTRRTQRLFLGAAIFLIAVAGFIAVALSADKAGHDKFHEQFYSSLQHPKSKMPCCNDRDCRPAKYKIEQSGVSFFVGGKWIEVPKRTVMETVTPDGLGHWCGIEEHRDFPVTYCAVLPFQGI
jgi:hypothetical protein